MRALRPIALLVIAGVLVAGRGGAETPAASRLEGRLPDNILVVSIDQTRGTVLDALSEISKQAGWSLVVTAPESVASRVLTIQVRKRPLNEALDMVLEAGSLRAIFADGVLKVRPGVAAESGGSERERRSWRGRHRGKNDRIAIGQSLRIEADEVVSKAVAVGGSLTVLGHVRGNTVAVSLRPGSRVDGDAVAIGGTVTVEEGARLEGDNVSLGGEPVAWVVSSLTPLRAYGPIIGLAWTRALLLFGIALLIALAFPNHVVRVRTFLTTRPGLSSLGGARCFWDSSRSCSCSPSRSSASR